MKYFFPIKYEMSLTLVTDDGTITASGAEYLFGTTPTKEEMVQHIAKTIRTCRESGLTTARLPTPAEMLEGIFHVSVVGTPPWWDGFTLEEVEEEILRQEDASWTDEDDDAEYYDD